MLFISQGVEGPHFNESLVAAFERIAGTFPSRTAVGSDVWEPTYRELNETANRLAHQLIANGVVSEDRVAILMSHDAPLVAAVLGTLKAGSIVVALDPSDPVSRLKMLLEDARPSIIVTDVPNQTLADKFLRTGCRVLEFEPGTPMGLTENPSIAIPPHQTAFLTYTSGTTGFPKGVMKSHRQLRRAAAVNSEAMQSTETDRIPLFASISTGQGATGLWSLLSGAMLWPFSLKTRGVTGLADWIIDRGLTVYFSSSSLFRSLIKTIDDRLVFSNVRAVRLSGEAATADDFRSFRKHFPPTSVFIHMFSSSETSNIAWSRWTQADDLPEGVLPEGVLPAGNFSREVSLLADNGQPVAVGEVGEVVVKSRYVANGYWRDPELTAERFSDDLDSDGTRMVRLGDLARINAAGSLEFCGRKDDRVKIRGNRIELMDIERALERLPGIDRAAAIAARRENREPLLIAFVVTTSEASWTAPRLRGALRANLPLHMLPSRIVFLDSLPYNSGNKIDREALRQFSLPLCDSKKGDGPLTPTEMLLADIWSSTLELPDIGRGDDFFNLGGDSLSGAVVAAQVFSALGINLSLSDIADHSTLSTLAEFIDDCRPLEATKMPPIVRVPRATTMPMSLLQETIWNDCQRRENRVGLTHVRSYRVVGPLDIKVLKACLIHLIDRHEILRTTFGLVDGCPAQIIHKSGPIDLSFLDLADADDPENQADSILREESSREIDLGKLPIRRNLLIRLAENSYRLVRISHPLITDGFASQILDAELASLYEAMLHGKQPPFPKEPPLQYADYAVWQRQVIHPDSPYFTDAVSWWRNIFATKKKANPLPFRRLIRRAPLDPNEGTLQWKLEDWTAQRLNEIARNAGATHFTVRLAAFAALIADVTGSSTVVIGTTFANRNYVNTQNIVGPFLDTAHLVFCYDGKKTFLQWVEFVRHQVFEATTRSELPYDMLEVSAVEPPEIEFYFTMSKDHSDQHFGNLTVRNEFCSVGVMPRKCMFEIDERRSENCRVNFDANLYDRSEMRLMLNRYLRLLEAAGHEPELPIGRLLAKTGAKPLRWTYANYAAPFYELIKDFYASSPLLKMCWRPIKRLVLSA
jgi:amino acid adenylation domain-containing protein